MSESSLFQAITSLSRQIQEHLNKDILKEGDPIIILEGYDWLREVMSLLAKQSNLFESCVLLLENNMEKEAYILARSQFNNMLWISYICNDIRRAEEYYHEALISHIQQLKNIKKYLRSMPNDTPHFDKFSTLDLNRINSDIGKINRKLKKAGYITSDPKRPLKNKSILKLTEQDSSLLGLYYSFYHEASKYEHADMSIVTEYRKPVTNDISKDIAYTLDMSESNINLWKIVFKHSLMVLFQSIERIYKRIKNFDSHLFESGVFNETDFGSIIINIKLAYDLLYDNSSDNF